MASDPTLLVLSILAYELISQEDAESLDAVRLRLLFGTAKKPKKSTFELSVTLDSLTTTSVVVSGKNLKSINDWYGFFVHACALKSKFLLFAKSEHHEIGSGFISNHLHFASYIRQVIFEFLLVKINKDIFNRLCGGTRLIPDELIKTINHTFNFENTVSSLVEKRQNQEHNTFVQIRNNANELEKETVNDIVIKNDQKPLTKITVWSKYSVLLYALNNTFYAIDEHY